MGAGEIPEWLNLTATLIILVIVGVVTRLAHIKATGVQSSEEAEVVGAVIDPRAVRALSEVIEFALDRVMNLHDERVRHDKNQLEELSYLRKEIRELTHAMKEMAAKGARSHGNAE